MHIALSFSQVKRLIVFTALSSQISLCYLFINLLLLKSRMWCVMPMILKNKRFYDLSRKFSSLLCLKFKVHPNMEMLLLFPKLSFFLLWRIRRKVSVLVTTNIFLHNLFYVPLKNVGTTCGYMSTWWKNFGVNYPFNTFSYNNHKTFLDNCFFAASEPV